MPQKQALKRALGAEGDLSLIDTDRIIPKADGGTYDDLENVRLLHPREHMERHGNLRLREAALEELKAWFDERVQVMKLQFKIQNQLSALTRRTDHMLPDMQEFLFDMLQPVLMRRAEVDGQVKQFMEMYAGFSKNGGDAKTRLAQVALNVKGLGFVTVAALTIYVDLTKAGCASALWSYSGIDKPSHARYVKGKTSGGNKTLRTALWNSAMSLIRDVNSPYRIVYDNVRLRLDHSTNLVMSRTTEGKLIECMWKDTKDGHRHGAALRAIMKHVLADYWFVGREIFGLPTRPLYVEEKLGHTGIIKPRERGWVW
jgi:hypothetical protein